MYILSKLLNRYVRRGRGMEAVVESIIEYGTGWVCPSICQSVCPSVRVLQKPPSRCPISKLSIYSESSWSCGSFKIIQCAIGTLNFVLFFIATAKGGCFCRKCPELLLLFFSRNAAEGGCFASINKYDIFNNCLKDMISEDIAMRVRRDMHYHARWNQVEHKKVRVNRSQC